MTGEHEWASDDRHFVVVLSESAWCTMRQIVEAAEGVETGGILIGRYDADHSVAEIIEVVGPAADSTAGRTWFQRGVKRMNELLRSRWREAPPTYYLGEWHHHPSTHIEPSGADICAMQSIAKDASYRCPEPILLIVGVLNARPAARAYVFPRDQSWIQLHSRSPT